MLRTKRYKVSFGRALFILFWYSFTVAIITITVLAFTPAKKWIFFLENEKLLVQEKRIKNLEKQLFMLTKEVNKISATNKRLKYALILASEDTLKKDSSVYDSLRKPDVEIKPSKGNLLASVFYFLKNLFLVEDSTQIVFIKPVAGAITRGFNPEEGHLGIDFGVEAGQPVFAAAKGLVIFADYTIDYGYVIIIKHEKGFLSIYKHCSSLLKKERENVEQGEIIALSGNSGIKTTGPHLHFEIWENGKPVDPESLLIK